MHDLAINKEHRDTTACGSSPLKEPILGLAYTDSGLPEPKIIPSTFPGPDHATIPPPNTFRSGRIHYTTACCVTVPKEPLLPLGAD